MGYSDPEKQKQYQREWLAQRRAEWLVDKSCVICQSTDNLEIDHVDPARKLSHRVWSWAPARREAELAKCQVLCQQHHLEKTLTYRQVKALPCGTEASYRKRCRCSKCTEAHRLYNKDRREKRRMVAVV